MFSATCYNRSSCVCPENGATAPLYKICYQKANIMSQMFYGTGDLIYKTCPVRSQNKNTSEKFGQNIYIEIQNMSNVKYDMNISMVQTELCDEGSPSCLHLCTRLLLDGVDKLCLEECSICPFQNLWSSFWLHLITLQVYQWVRLWMYIILLLSVKYWSNQLNLSWKGIHYRAFVSIPLSLYWLFPRTMNCFSELKECEAAPRERD